MGLTVENGQGLANADSYLSVADADAYHLAHSASSTWSGAEEAAKEKAMRLATQFIDIRYGSRFVGNRANASQALDWPRMAVQDRDGYLLDYTVVPQAVKNATAEAALRFLTTDLLADVDDSAAVKSHMVKVGPITETTEYAQPNEPTPEYTVIDGLLRKIVRASGEIRRA